MRKHELTEFGRSVKVELVVQNQTQQWLIERMKEKADIYVDSSNLHKLLTGKIKNSRLEGVICEVLGISIGKSGGII